MKCFLIAVGIAAVAITTSAVAADVGVSISIGQPGFYGQLDIGGYPSPPVIYSQPIIVQPGLVGRPPIYLRVPQDHVRHWRRHCAEYNACGERVFFVQDDWYNQNYAPRYQEQHRGRQDDYRDKHNDKRRDDQRDGHQGNDHDRGHDH